MEGRGSPYFPAEHGVVSVLKPLFGRGGRGFRGELALLNLSDPHLQVAEIPDDIRAGLEQIEDAC